MKNLFIFYVFASAILVFAGCNKDDDGAPNIQNEFILNGETYALSKGFITEYGTNGNGSFDFDLVLTSSSINYSDSNQDFNGIGDFIYLDLNSSSEQGLVNGTYNFSSDRNSFTFVPVSNLGTDYDLAALTGEDFNILGGTVEVTIDGNETEFTLDLTISNGTSVEGHFKGILRPY